MKRYASISLFVFGLSLSPSIQAATYYVRNDGNNSCNGQFNVSAIQQPNCAFQTIQRAADIVVAGDQVWVANGHYVGFYLDRSGENGQPIVFRAQGSNVIINTPIPDNSAPNDRCNGTAICILGNDGVGQHDLRVEGFIMEELPRGCIDSHDACPEHPHRRITVRNNICRNIAIDGGAGSTREGFYFSEVADSLIEGNTIHDISNPQGERDHGMYIANTGCDNTIIRGNHIYNIHASGAGIHFNGDASVDTCDGSSDSYVISGLVIENNIIHDVMQQNALNMDGVQDSDIRNNLIYNIDRHGLRAYRIDAASGPSDLRIVNNIFFGEEASYEEAVLLTSEAGPSTIFNNILVERNATVGQQGDNFFMNHNSATLLQFFMNPAGGDFHLRPGTALIDSGRSSLNGVMAPGVDLEGLLRPAGSAHDMGPYEYGATPADPDPPAAPGRLRLR